MKKFLLVAGIVAGTAIVGYELYALSVIIDIIKVIAAG